MANIARNAVKEPTTLRTPQNAIWCGKWVVSLGLFFIAGLDILATYGWSLNSVLVLVAVGLGPLLVLTMLCGFNVSEMPEKVAFDPVTRAQTGQFRHADLFYRARRQLKWNSLVRAPVLARIIPAAGRPLQPATFKAVSVGTISLDFNDASNATMTTTLNGITQVRNIERQPY